MVQNQMTPEQDQRLRILNTLLTTPHRALDKVFPVHTTMIQQDPMFYGHLGAWYANTGEVRDHKECFVINLCLSEHEEHRDAGLALLREMPPYQVARVVDFIHGTDKARKEVTTTGRGRARKSVSRTVKEKFGLYQNLPRSMKTEIKHYLREREENVDWFDTSVLVARSSMKRLYALVRVKPTDRARAILFERNPPDDSKLKAVKDLRKADTAAEQARVIVENKIPYRIASTVIHAMTPTVILALIEVMTDQELINNLGSLRKRGAMNNSDIKKVIQDRLGEAKKGKRVAALKSLEAAKASGVDEEMQAQLAEVADEQVKSKGRIERPTALLIDKSSSMEQAIEIGKRMASMISAVMDADLIVYAFDTMPYKITSKGTDIGSWEKALKMVRAGGCTSCGCAIAAMTRNQEYVEQIVMITDEGHNQSPPFLGSLQQYATTMNVQPSVVMLRCGHSRHRTLTDQAIRAGFDVQDYDFDGDYYSLPNLIPFLTQPSKLDLLMEIMETPLPTRKVA